MNYINKWKYGAFILLTVFFIGIVAPPVIVAIFGGPILIVLHLLGLDISFIDNHQIDIAVISIILLGPYMLSEIIEELLLITHSRKTNKKILV